MADPDSTPIDRSPYRVALFWAKVNRSAGLDACWLWESSTNRKGYGRFDCRVKHIGKPTTGRSYIAHRYIYQVEKGLNLTRDVLVMHSCDNPPCVNPRHLRHGSSAENTLDMVIKGRAPRGERQARAVLIEADVIFIRSGNDTDGELAKRFGLTTAGIRDVRQGRNWAHVNVPPRAPTRVVRGDPRSPWYSRVAIGLCGECGLRPLVSNRTLCAKCQERKQRAYARIKSRSQSQGCVA